MACHPERVLTTRVLGALVVPRVLARTRDLFGARGTFEPSRAIAIAAAAVFVPHWITIFASCFWDARAAGWAGEQVRAVAAAVAGRSDWCAFVLADVAVWSGLVSWCNQNQCWCSCTSSCQSRQRKAVQTPEFLHTTLSLGMHPAERPTVVASKSNRRKRTRQARLRLHSRSPRTQRRFDAAASFLNLLLGMNQHRRLRQHKSCRL